jgi:NADH:ubiquinone oxidoreductase subunit 2 (subunit N)
MGRSLGPNYLLLIMLVLSFSGLGMLYYARPRRKMVIAKRSDGATELKTASKIVTLTKETTKADQN